MPTLTPAVLGPYLLFAGESYYPAPSWDEFRGAFATLEEASRAIHEQRIPARPDCSYGESIEWYQIVSLHTLSVLEAGGYGYGGQERPGVTQREFKDYRLPEKENPL